MTMTNIIWMPVHWHKPYLVFRIVQQRQRLDAVLPRLPWWTLYLMNIHPDGYLMSSLRRLFLRPEHHSKWVNIHVWSVHNKQFEISVGECLLTHAFYSVDDSVLLTNYLLNVIMYLAENFECNFVYVPAFNCACMQ
jgi:hypothetical protein